MPSARTICTRALRKLGAAGQGDTISPNDMSEAFDILNDMIDGWAADRLSIFVIERAQFALVAHQASYTLGTGGNFNRVRPVTLDKISIITDANNGDELEIPIEVLDLAQYQGIGLKATESNLPMKAYRDFANPLMNIKFWPVPDSNDVDCVLYCPTALVAFANLDTLYNFPPGYKRAIEFNLAVEMAPDFEKEPSNVVMAKATDYLAEIRMINAGNQAEIIPVDAALRTMGGGERGAFNWRTGQ